MHSLCSILLICITVYAKDLHVKEAKTETVKDDDNIFLDFYHYDDYVDEEKERNVRHVELVTESILEHLLNEFNNKYADKTNHSSRNVPNLMNRLKMKINQMKKKKLKNHKRKPFHRFNSTSLQITNTTIGYMK